MLRNGALCYIRINDDAKGKILNNNGSSGFLDQSGLYVGVKGIKQGKVLWI